MSIKQIPVAVIGGGLNSAVGQAHMIALQMDGRFKIVAACFSQDMDVNTKTANANNISTTAVYEDWRSMLDEMSSSLSAVLILTPTPTHTEIVLDCLARNIPIICEKALCGSTTEVKAIKDAMIRYNGQLIVTYNYSGYPMLRELRSRINQGMLGNLTQILVEMPQEGFVRKNPQTGKSNMPQQWRLKDKSLAMVSLDLGVHLHQMIHFLSGETPTAVVAVEDHFGSVSDVVDNVTCIAKYTGNLLCNIWYGKSALGYRNGLRIRLFGTEGSAEWVQTDPEIVHFCDAFGNKSIIDRTHSDNIVAHQERYNRFKAGHPAGFIEAFANYYVDIADLLQKSTTMSPHNYVFGLDVAAEGLHMLEAIEVSSKDGSWMKISR